MPPQVILHLSDLHFGCDKSESERALRSLALDGLISAILKLDAEWQPTILCISGDVAWKGKAPEYQEASRWLNNLLNRLNISPDHVLICAGNHDIDRDAVIYSRPRDAADADQMLSVPIDLKFLSPFDSYCKFAQSIGVPELRLGTRVSNLIGQRKLEGISFCCLNSAWFCRDGSDKDNLWIGRPYLDVLEQNNQILHPEKLALAEPTVFLLHHPKNWLGQAEIHSYNGRPNTFDVVAGRCHLLLTGHTHGESRRPDRNGGAAHVMTGGATYDSGTYNNAFTLIRVGEDRFVYRTFDFDPRSAIREWRQTIAASELLFRDSVVQGGSSYALRTMPQLADYRDASRHYAEEVIRRKSRALKPHGELPRAVPSLVRIEVDSRQTDPNSSVRKERNREPRSVPLIDAIRSAKRTLLLGDLGSGKSTLAATLAIESQDRTQDSIAIFVPAKLLPLAAETGVAWKSVKEFLASASTFVNNHVVPTAEGFDLLALLDAAVEVRVIVDGLDEVSFALAREILDRLADVVDHWATVEVLATGRPIELQGLDHAKWQLCSPVPIHDDDKFQFFVEEGLANGENEDTAAVNATTALERLRSLPELHLSADTPLFCRLLFGQLKDGQQDALTLGDLLYGLLTERLSGWPAQDNKATGTHEFDRHYPDSGSRVSLLSDLAASMTQHHRVPEEVARKRLDALIPNVSGVSKSQVIEQALRVFESAGLVSLEGGNFELSLRTFDDFCRGHSFSGNVLQNPGVFSTTKTSEWRTVAFGTTMFRRFRVMDEVRSLLSQYLGRALKNHEDISPVASIVVESQDSCLAKHYVQKLSELGRRPLWFSFENPTWPQAAQAVAESLRLAGEDGFDWFYREYLDPRYPFVFTGSQLTVEVFVRWAALHIGKVSDQQRSALMSMIQPHVTAESMQASMVVPALAVLMPDAFDGRTRMKHCIQLLESSAFRDPAERLIRREFEHGNRQELLEQFSRSIVSFDGTQHAPLLYLSLTNSRPSSEIIRAIIAPKRGGRRHLQREHTLQKLKAILGAECFSRFCRWYLFDSNTMLAGGAAVELFGLGERRPSFLSSALIQALHDGAYTPRAEEILATIISEEGTQAAQVVASYIVQARPNSRNGGLGGHSGWWRLLFRFIYDSELRGPELLVHCLPGIGEFLLPRYPEIRSSFRDLVLGPRSAEFREALHDGLNHEDPQVRHGAAMVLVTSDPATEAQALETVVAWKARHHYGAWFEWEQFCLILQFGPAVLSHLQSRLNRFSGETRLFALAILFRNGVELDDTLFQELITGSLTTPVGSEVLADASHAGRIQKALLEVLDKGSEDAARKAAGALLGGHSSALDEEHHLRCMALILDSGSWRTPEFASELKRLNQDAVYANRLEAESHRLISRGFKRPMIDLIFAAQKDPTLWDDLIWNEICAVPPILRIESRAQWVIDFQVKSPENRTEVAQSARRFLFDSRIAQRQNTDDVQAWLGLIAHEGGELSQGELGSLVDGIDPIEKTAYVPLITRLGRGPDNSKRRRRAYTPPPRDPKDRPSAETADLNKFLDYARPAASIHPDFCALIEESLFNPPFTKLELANLADKSDHGAMAAGALMTSYGLLPEPEWAIATMGQKPENRLENQHCMLTLHGLWRSMLFVAKQNEEWRSAYVARLKTSISNHGPSLAPMASALFSIEHSLCSEHLRIVLRHIAETAFDDYGLYESLADWLSLPESRDLIAQESDTIDAVIEELDLQPWDVDEGYPKDAGAYLMFPLLRWRIGGATDVVSRRVFLRGLKMALMPPRDAGRKLSGLPSRFVSIEEVAPLLSAVGRSILAETIQYGMTLEDKELRTLCKFFALSE